MDAMFKGLLAAIGMLIAVFAFKGLFSLISKTSSAVKHVASSSGYVTQQDDEMFYEIAGKEVDESRQRYGLWEKALVAGNGDVNAGRREYIRLRVIQLKDENNR